jgi:5-methylcytosine-specific restriction endonuclease McrA
VDTSQLAHPKGKTRKQVKAKAKRTRAAHVAEVRAYVFAREGGVCRCCGIREAQSMHEIRPRSLGGTVSRENSIAACGSGTTGCHGFMQNHEISVEPTDLAKWAEGRLVFRALTMRAMTHCAHKGWRVA